MKKYEMLPTEENLIETMYKDTINRNKDIVYFYNYFASSRVRRVQSQLMEDGEVVKLFLFVKQNWLSMR